MSSADQPDEPATRHREEIDAGDLAGIAGWMLRQRATASPGDHEAFVPPTAEAMAQSFEDFSEFEFIGAGGMGAVYRAHQTKLGREVAIKILSPAKRRDTGFRERFAREALSMAQMAHPNIVSIYETGERDELFYIVMEHVPGTTLREAMADGQIDANRALAIAREVCSALHHAHGRGVLHRDIKPANILLHQEGRAMLTDFGLAKLLDETKTDFTLTLTDAAFGTPAYMAPEQSQSMRDVDGRADLYSLGVVLYEMLTGQLPAGRFDPPPVAASAVMRALDNDPEKRFASAAEMEAALAEPARKGRPWWKLGAAAAIAGALLFAITRGKDAPDNGLGMPFVPLAGTQIEFARSETRVADFAAFVTATGHDATGGMFSFDSNQTTLPLVQKGASWRAPGFDQSDAHPVVGVSWHDAVAFCEWFTASEREAGRLEENLEYRLPTDREWSVASGLNELPPEDTQGGANLALADFLPWDEQEPPPPGSGNFADASATTLFPRLNALHRYDDGHPATAPVGALTPNAAGLNDMLGNVWEWTSPSKTTIGDDTPFRGGAWTTGVFRRYLPGLRMRWSPDLRRNDIGFRIVRAPVN